MIRLLFQTDEPVLAVGLGRILEGSGIDLSGVCTGFEEVTEKLKDGGARPDIILVNATPELNLSQIVLLGRLVPSSKRAIWARDITPEAAHQLLEVGVTGIMRKDLSPEIVCLCLQKVHAGEIWMDRSLVGSLLRARTVSLSHRERQLLKLVACGLSNKEIAAELFLSEGTVKVYLSRLFRKTGVHDRFELAIYGFRHCGISAGVQPGQRNWDETALPSRSLLFRNREDIA